MAAFTLFELVSTGKQLEIGCHACNLHIYLDPSILAVPADTPVPAVCDLLMCPQCKSQNAEPGYRIPLFVIFAHQ